MSSPSNAEQREFWAREGLQWVRDADRYDGMNREFGEAILDTARLRSGERVLDVGCGNGATSLDAARQVAPDGEVVGVDISAPMLEFARERAAAAGIDNLDFVEADAQVHRFEEATFDALVSRFGNMFFEDPEAAFANLLRAMKPDGRLVMTCWQDVLQSEWTAVPGVAAASHLGFPDFGPPGSPGAFAFADPDRLKQVLEAGGFRDIAIESITKPMRMGDDVDDVITFFTSLDLIREWFAANPEDKVAAAVDAVRDALAPFAGPDGLVMSGTAWLVSAKRSPADRR